MSKIPILVTAFNRADHVLKAMNSIKEYKPERLYLACDGPRLNKEGEKEAVEATRKAMIEAVDWPCEVKTLFQEKNLGCAQAMYNEITWFFEQEEYGIICEDDIVLGQDFFLLCEDLLPRYKNEERVVEIAAQNLSGRNDKKNSYVYSHRFHCWGWASWRRAWRIMDMTMSAAPSLTRTVMIKKLGVIRGLYMYNRLMYAYKHIESLSSWATRWYLSILSFDGLMITPGVNLAVNIGMNGGEHFNKWDFNPYSKIGIGHIEWPLVYNDNLIPDKKQKRYDNRDFLKERCLGLLKRIKMMIN